MLRRAIGPSSLKVLVFATRAKPSHSGFIAENRRSDPKNQHKNLKVFLIFRVLQIKETGRFTRISKDYFQILHTMALYAQPFVALARLPN
jgi:hypothetical protein